MTFFAFFFSVKSITHKGGGAKGRNRTTDTMIFNLATGLAIAVVEL